MDRDIRGRFVSGGNVKDISGQRFSHLVVLKLDHIKDKRSYWLCQCDCGNQKVVRNDCLKVIQSCGCVKKQQDIINFHIENHHGMSNHPAYAIWYGMMARCYRPKQTFYEDYGGRGIEVCDEWHDPKAFLQWADDNGFIPNQNLSLERKDVNGNYEPGNCVWIPRNEQSYNRRDTLRFVDEDGIEKSVAKVARERNFSADLATNRRKLGITIPKFLFYKGNLNQCSEYKEYKKHGI